MSKGRVNLPEDLRAMLAGDWERVLTQAMLGTEDRKIARLYVLDRVPQIDVAEEMHMDRSTISRRMVIILDEARRTAKRLNII